MQKTIAPYAAGLLRKDMGDAAYNGWIQRNGITPLTERPPAPAGLGALLTPDQQNAYSQPMQMPDQSQGLGALLQQMPQLPEVKPKGRGTANDILGSIFDVLAAAGGSQATYWPGVLQGQREEKEGQQRLAELMAQMEQKKAEREASFQSQTKLIDYRAQNPGPTSAARMAQEAGLKPGTPQYAQFITSVAQRPIMIGGEAYAPSAGGLPQGYDPNQWEVVE